MSRMPVDPTKDERFAIFSDDDRLFLKEFFARRPDIGENFDKYLKLPPALRPNFAKTDSYDIFRRGWKKRGVKAQESIFDHSYGLADFVEVVSIKALEGSGFDDETIRRVAGKLKNMAKLHDIMIEVIATDFTPGEISESDKERLELLAAKVILAAYPAGYALVEEFIKQESAVSHILHDFDKFHAVVKAAAIEAREPERAGICDEFLQYAKRKMKTPIGKNWLEGFEKDRESFQSAVLREKPGHYFGF